MHKQKMSLDLFVDMPEDMKRYLKNYGYHFNAKAYKYAVEYMYKQANPNAKMERLQPVEKEKVHELLKKYNVTLENDVMYDAVYLYSMGMADYMNVAFPNEQILALWIKATIDDVDAMDGHVFNSWYSKMCFNGYPIDWEELL
jgi:hypothetical protein